MCVIDESVVLLGEINQIKNEREKISKIYILNSL